MLHPKQFEVNDTWIVFRLNHAPIPIGRDGDFNCIALMDAASCFLLGSELIPVTDTDHSPVAFRRLFENAKRHQQQVAKTLLVPRENVADRLAFEATQQGIEVVRVPESQLLIFIGEAREAFAERFEGERPSPTRQ